MVLTIHRKSCNIIQVAERNGRRLTESLEWQERGEPEGVKKKIKKFLTRKKQGDIMNKSLRKRRLNRLFTEN